MKFKSEIEIQDQQQWLEDINFEKIRTMEETLLEKVKNKLSSILRSINQNGVELYDKIEFGQFEFNYYISEDGQVEIKFYLKQQTAGCDVVLDDDQWENYFYLLPYQVFHYDSDLEEEHYPLVRILSEWDDLQRLEDWVENGDLEKWILEKYIVERMRNW